MSRGDEFSLEYDVFYDPRRYLSGDILVDSWIYRLGDLHKSGLQTNVVIMLLDTIAVWSLSTIK